EMGKHVSLLALLDTGVGINREKLSLFSRIAGNMLYHLKAGVFYTASFLKSPRKTVRFFKNQLENSLEAAELIEINNNYRSAFEKYILKPQEISAVLFRAKNRVYFMEDSEYYGWKQYLKCGIHVVPVEGEHNTFILEPHAHSFANQLQTVIDNTTS